MTQVGRPAGILQPWWDLGMLALEVQQVMWLRCLKLGRGGPIASAEAQRMVVEKVAVAAQAGAGMLMGDPPAKAMRRYRKKVRANRRRLAR